MAEAVPPPAKDLDQGRLAGVAGRLAMTEGQLYTVVLGLVFAIGSALIALPAINSGDIEQALGTEQVTDIPVGNPEPGSDTGFGSGDDRITTTTTSTTTVPSGVSPPTFAPPATVGTLAPIATTTTSSSSVTTTTSPASTTTTTAPPATTTTTVAPPATGETRKFASVPSPGFPGGIALGPGGEIWVGTANSEGDPSLLRYRADGTLAQTVPIQGRTGLGGLAVDAGGRIHTVTKNPSTVIRVDPVSRSIIQVAEIPNVPQCAPVGSPPECEPGLENKAPIPVGLAFGPSGAIFVADAGQGIVWRVSGGQAKVWKSDSAWVSVDGDTGPTGITVAANGDVLVSVAAAPTSGSGGGVFRIVANSDRTAGASTKIITTAGGSSASELAIGSGGSIYVALRGASAVAVYSAAGAETARWSTGDIRPGGLTFFGTSLLVTGQNGSDVATASVLQIGTGESGVRAFYP